MAPVWLWLRVGGWERPLYSYGLMLSCAALVGAASFIYGAHRRGWDVGAAIVVVAAAALAGTWGARALFAWVTLCQGGSIRAALLPGGVVFYGGLIGGAIGLLGAARAQRLPVRRVVDAAVVPVCLGHAIGRVGCLLGGCCYGRPFAGPWAVTYTHPLSPLHDGIARHPWPLYEATLMLLFALWLATAGAPATRGVRPGYHGALYLAVYAIVRFSLEFFRGDSLRGLIWNGALSTSQVIASATFVLAAWLLWRWRRVPGT